MRVLTNIKKKKTFFLFPLSSTLGTLGEGQLHGAKKKYFFNPSVASISLNHPLARTYTHRTKRRYHGFRSQICHLYVHNQRSRWILSLDDQYCEFQQHTKAKPIFVQPQKQFFSHTHTFLLPSSLPLSLYIYIYIY